MCILTHSGSDLRWPRTTVEKYQIHVLAEDSDDNKKIRQANARPLQKRKRKSAAEKKKKLQQRPSLVCGKMGSGHSLSHPYTTTRGQTPEPNDICF